MVPHHHTGSFLLCCAEWLSVHRHLQVMFAEPLGARPLGRGSSGEMLPTDEHSGGASDSAGYLAGSGAAGPATSAEENVAAAAAAAAVAGMHHSFMAASPAQEATCSTSMQLHTPMTGEKGGCVTVWEEGREGGPVPRRCLVWQTGKQGREAGEAGAGWRD